MFHIALEQFLHEHFLGCFRISYPLARTSGSVSAVAAVCMAAAVLFLSQRGKQKVWGKSFSKIDIFCQCSDVPEQGCPTENKYLCSYLVLVFLWLFSLLWKCQWKRWSQGKEGSYNKPKFPTKRENCSKMPWGPTPEENPIPASAERAMNRGDNFCAIPCRSVFYLNSFTIMAFDWHFLGLWSLKCFIIL